MNDDAFPLHQLHRLAESLPAGQLIPHLVPDADAVPRGPQRPLRAVVVAPPGTGKTTVVPPALAHRSSSRVVVTQPRRMAARAAARRLAHLTGTQLGREVGFTVRGDRQVCADTRVEFVTTGVLLRRLINDPAATGVSAVVLDEVHERQLDTDLAVAFVQQVAELRGDLDVVVMSATVDAARWAELLGEADSDGADTDGTGSHGGPAQILRVETHPYPLTQRWAPMPGTHRALDARGVSRDFLRHVSDVIIHHSGSEPGDVLVFLPGAREINTVAGQLSKHFSRRSSPGQPGRDVPEILPLLGSTPTAEQDRILRPHAAPSQRSGPSAQRIVLATNVAESALTVPGVRLVVDAGLDRQSRLDTRRGIAGLITVGASKAAMVQRAGRGAREAAGTVVRCLSEAEFAARPAETPAEIRTADLTQTVLDLACWGAPGGVGLRLPDPLPSRSYATAVTTLTQLGALAEQSPQTAQSPQAEQTKQTQEPRVTELGRRLARLPVDPRLGRGLLDGADLTSPRLAAEVTAALSGDQRAPGADLAGLLRALRRDQPRRFRDDVARLHRAVRNCPDPEHAPQRAENHAEQHEHGGAFDIGLITALAYPHQIARRRRSSDTDYLLASGTAATLPRDSGLRGLDWLAVAEVTLHGQTAIIRTAAELDQDHAELAAGPLLREETQARFADGAAANKRHFHRTQVTVREITRLGAIELSSTPVPPRPEHTRAAVITALKDDGVLSFFGVDTSAATSDTSASSASSFITLRNRMGLLHRVLGAAWPDVTDTALTARIGQLGRTGSTGGNSAPEDWLSPEIDQLSHGTPAHRIDLASALRRLLPWPEAARLDELAPQNITVPSGSRVRLRWPAPEEHTDDEVASPVLAVKLQECFGFSASPTVARGRVPVVLHLLSPAQRPLAVTADLASFWTNIYPQVRAENRGHYVKHPWPEDPWNASATSKTNRALRNQ